MNWDLARELKLLAFLQVKFNGSIYFMNVNIRLIFIIYIFQISIQYTPLNFYIILSLPLPPNWSILVQTRNQLRNENQKFSKIFNFFYTLNNVGNRGRFRFKLS